MISDILPKDFCLTLARKPGKSGGDGFIRITQSTVEAGIWYEQRHRLQHPDGIGERLLGAVHRHCGQRRAAF